MEGYEQSLSFIIKEEKAYARKSVMGDLGVRVQNSGTGDPTAKAAIENVMIMLRVWLWSKIKNWRNKA